MNEEDREELIQRYVRGEATEADMAALERLIEENPSIVQEFVMAADLEAGFKEALKRSHKAPSKKISARKTTAKAKAVRPSQTWIAVTGAVAAMIAVAVLLNLPKNNVESNAVAVVTETAQIGSVSSTSPDVLIVRAGKNVSVSAETPLRLGDVLRVPPGKNAKVVYTDKSTFTAGCPVRPTVALFTEYSVLPSGEPAVGKKVELDSGEMAGHVEKQPAGKPMVLSTPRAIAEVLGTTIKLVAETENTRLDVVEGKVRLHRVADSAFTLVSGGEYAVASREITEFLPRTMTPKARMTITCDDRYEVYVNGALVGRREWPKGPTHFESQMYELVLRPDKNVVAVKGGNIDNIAGLIAEIHVGPNRLVTGKEWKVSQDVESNWSAVDYDDSKWTRPAEFGTVDSPSPGKHARATLFPLNSKAQWIWIENNHFSAKKESHNVVYFRYTFDVSKLER
jgi:hypothetical protein